MLLLAAIKRSSCDEKLCVRTQISDMHALLCLKPVKCLHHYVGATGSVMFKGEVAHSFKVAIQIETKRDQVAEYWR